MHLPPTTGKHQRLSTFRPIEIAEQSANDRQAGTWEGGFSRFWRFLRIFLGKLSPVASWRRKLPHQDSHSAMSCASLLGAIFMDIPDRPAVELYACTHKVRRRRSRANPSCYTSLKGSLTTRFSKRTHRSHGETRVTCPIAPAGIFTGGSSSHLSLTRCPTAKFPFSWPSNLSISLSCIRPSWLALFPKTQRTSKARCLAGFFRSPAHG